jgi:hypothetical protein
MTVDMVAVSETLCLLPQTLSQCDLYQLEISYVVEPVPSAVVGV